LFAEASECVQTLALKFAGAKRAVVPPLGAFTR
jgi:hypothetical protein